MMKSPRSTRLPGSQAYETAMEDLAKLLQDTGSSVERILSSFSAASLKNLGPKVSEVRTSLSIGINPSTLNNRAHTSPSEAQSLENTFVNTFGAGQFLSAASKAAHHQRDVQNWFAQAHPDKAGLGKTSLGLNTLAFNEEGTSSGENALKVLLEEIKQATCDWSARQKVMMQHKPGLMRSIPHTATAGSSGPGLPNGALLSFDTNKEQNMKALSTQGVKEAPVHQNEKEVGNAVQLDKESEKSLLNSELEKSAHLDKVVDDIANQLLQSDDEDAHTNHLQRTQTASRQNASENEKAAETPLAADVGPAQGSISQPASVATEENAAAMPAPEESTPVTDSFVTPTKTDQAEAKLPLTKWKPPTSAKNKDKTLSFPLAVEVISSPDWLPEGWITELKTRGSGNSAGSKDKYYVDPVSNRRFRSRKEVVAYVERGKPKLSSDSPEASPIKKLLGPEPLLSAPKRSHKKAKPKDSSTPSSSVLPPPMVSSIASPGLVGNMFMPPFRTGQPSEWLVYESLASLPFPMFDPFYYGDVGANKSSSSKSSHMPARPWFFSGPEASWSPFMDRSSLGKSGDKGRDYHSYFSMPPYPSDATPKPSTGSSKKSSKRKSADL